MNIYLNKWLTKIFKKRNILQKSCRTKVSSYLMLFWALVNIYSCTTIQGKHGSILKVSESDSCSLYRYCINDEGGKLTGPTNQNSNSKWYCNGNSVEYCANFCFFSGPDIADQCRKEVPSNPAIVETRANEELLAITGVQITSYYPDSSALQGGFNDRHGKCLQTTQDYLEGKSSFVSVAMDYKEQTIIPDFTIVLIPGIGEKFGDPNMKFCKVDTGGAFVGAGTSMVDIASPNRETSYGKIGKTFKNIIFKTKQSCREAHRLLNGC